MQAVLLISFRVGADTPKYENVIYLLTTYLNVIKMLTFCIVMSVK